MDSSLTMGQDSLPTVIAGSDPLSDKQERFAQMLRLGLPSAEAYREAGFQVEASSFVDNARKLANKPKVKDRVNYLRRQEQDVWEEKRKILEERQWLWHQADIGQFYEVIDEPILTKAGYVTDAEGNPIMRKRERLKPISELPLELRMCVDSLTFTDSGKPNLKLYSKADANRELRKINGIDVAKSEDESDPTSRLPDKEFFAELAKQASELGVNLKMTFEAMVEPESV